MPEIQCLQWSLYGYAIGGGGQWILTSANAAAPSNDWPLIIPAGWYFGLKYAIFGSKFTDGPAPVDPAIGDYGSRASMLILSNIVSVPDNVGAVYFNPPKVVLPGQALEGIFSNSDNSPQNMMAAMGGLLVHNADPSVTTGVNAYKPWYEAFSFLFQ